MKKEIEHLKTVISFLDKGSHQRKALEKILSSLSDEPLYVGTYLYVSPDDTLAEGEKPTVQVNTVMGTLEDVMSDIHEHFDGYETFEETFKPEVRDHFKKTPKKNYGGDDYSAGQWFEIAPILNNTIKQIGEML